MGWCWPIWVGCCWLAGCRPLTRLILFFKSLLNDDLQFHSISVLPPPNFGLSFLIFLVVSLFPCFHASASFASTSCGQTDIFPCLSPDCLKWQMPILLLLLASASTFQFFYTAAANPPNQPNPAFFHYILWSVTGVPANCKVRLPVLEACNCLSDLLSLNLVPVLAHHSAFSSVLCRIWQLGIFHLMCHIKCQ